MCVGLREGRPNLKKGRGTRVTQARKDQGEKGSHAHTQGLTAVVGSNLLLLQVVHHFRLAMPGLALSSCACADRGEAGGRREKGEDEDAQRATRTKGSGRDRGTRGTVVCGVCVCVEGGEKVVWGRGTLRGGREGMETPW